LIGDPSKAKEKLGWKPQYDLKSLVVDMVQSDLKLFQKQLTLLDNGYKILNQAE
jgi:GDPmannose 4,6-dehydratase